MGRWLTWLLGGVVALGLLGEPARAQEYRFNVPLAQMEVTVKPDASVHVAYDITFRNQPGAHVIDIVDIGVPHDRYSLQSVKASCAGRALGDVRPSTMVKPGFEVHMGASTIAPGQQGTLHVEFDVPDMVFQDTTQAGLASLGITPTWFGDQYVMGNTHLQVAIQLPKGVRPEEVLHQGANFQAKAATDQGARVGWDWPATRLTQAHMVGASFPKRDMTRVVTLTKLDLLLKWFRESPDARVICGVVFLALFALLYFRFTGGTGVSLFVILSAVAVLVFILSPGLHLLSLPAVVVLVGLNEWYLGRRRLRYMPAIAQVEGGGIKRGLTAPEAAVLLELPVAKVLALVIFGMLKKGLVHQLQADPLVVEVDESVKVAADDLAEATERETSPRKTGRGKGTIIHQYEHAFLYLLQKNPGRPVKDIDFAVPVRRLIERVASRMSGFDLSDTKDYYRSIVRRATEQAQAIGDIPQRQKALDRNFEWILMGDDYTTVFGSPYRPIWTRGPIHGGGMPTAPIAPSAPSIPGRTSFGDVAASFAGWAENTMGSMASAISPGSLSVSRPSGGILDLSGADRVTGEFFKALGEAASNIEIGGGGGGGGCACACAGCACACACAGGGR